MPDTPAERPGLAIRLTTTVVTALAMVTTWLVALRTGLGQRLDWMAYDGLTDVVGGRAWSDVQEMLPTVRDVAIAAFVVVAGILVVTRRAWLAGAQALVLLAGSVATVVVLNAATASVFQPHAVPVYPFDQSVDMATTLLTAAGFGIVVAAHPGYRALLAIIVAVVVGALSAAQLTFYAQRPSTFLTALLSATVWAALVAGLVRLVRRHRPADETPPPSHGTATAVGGSFLALIGLTALVASAALAAQWYQGTLPVRGVYGEQAMTFLAAALAVGGLACLVFAVGLAAFHVPAPGTDDENDLADDSGSGHDATDVSGDRVHGDRDDRVSGVPDSSVEPARHTSQHQRSTR